MDTANSSVNRRRVHERITHSEDSPQNRSVDNTSANVDMDVDMSHDGVASMSMNINMNTTTTMSMDMNMSAGVEDPYELLELPPLVLVIVLGSLPAADVLRAASACKGLHALCHHNGVWKRVSKRKWLLRPSMGISKPARWRQYYAQRLAIARDGSFKWLAGKPMGDLPSKRYQHTGSAVGPIIYYIGGQELPEKRFNDIFTFNTETNEIRKIAPASGTPPRFARHSAVTINKTIYLFGGFDGVSQHFHLAAYHTDANVWSVPEVVGDVPPSRTNHAAAAINGRMYIFGGMYKDNHANNDKLVFLNDMYCLDTKASPMRWTRLMQHGDLPAPRCGHRLLALGSRLVLFGGGCGEQWDMKYSDVHVYNPATMTWTRPRISGCAPVCTFTVAFVMGVFLFVFGGQSLHDNNLTNELYVLDTVAMHWTKIIAQFQYPSPRDMASGNVVDNVMYMFGGYCGSAIDNFYMLHMDPTLGGSQRAKPTLPPGA